MTARIVHAITAALLAMACAAAASDAPPLPPVQPLLLPQAELLKAPALDPIQFARAGLALDHQEGQISL